jgi:recyclin-1
MVGRWPESVLLRIVEYLPIPDLPAVARASRAFSRVVKYERGWEARCRYLRLDPAECAQVLRYLLMS